jgi:hypothetical protein
MTDWKVDPFESVALSLTLEDQDGTRGPRIAFLSEVSGPAEARKSPSRMVAQVRRT